MQILVGALWLVLFLAGGFWVHPSYLRYVNLYRNLRGHVPGLHTAGDGPIEHQWATTTPHHWTILWRQHPEPALEAARKAYLRRVSILLLFYAGGLAAAAAAINAA